MGLQTRLVYLFVKGVVSFLFFSPVTTWQRSVLISDPQIER
jgi:hypothetical protein